MAVQIINHKDPLRQGTNFASGLGQALSHLATSKVNEIKRQREAQGLQALGYGEEQAQGISQLNPELQKTLLHNNVIERTAQAKLDQISSKESMAYVNDISKQYKAAEESNKRLNRMEHLIKKGNLPNSTWYRFFKSASEVGSHGSDVLGLGKIVGILANPIGGAGLSAQRAKSSDVEEFEKLSADFIKNAKDFFPGRVTNTELESFLQTIPTLAQSDQGKLAIIENIKSFNKAAEVRDKALKAIIKANGGKRPANLSALVDELVGPELDKLSETFKSRTHKPVEYFSSNHPEGQGRNTLGLFPNRPSVTGL
jgi:hypothetical protein